MCRVNEVHRDTADFLKDNWFQTKDRIQVKGYLLNVDNINYIELDKEEDSEAT